MADVALTVGGSVLSAFLQVLFNRMDRPEFLNLYRKQKCDYRILKTLRWKLLVLRGVLEDAENKQTKNLDVKEWLEELQEVVYQADDLLDQISTEALRVKVESRYPSPANQVSASRESSNFTVHFLKEMMPKLEDIVQQLEDFEQKIGILGLMKEVETKKKPFRLSSTSLVENDVCGRDADKVNIVEALLSDENVSVISIVGLGGIGKTTLAQYVYNDERVRFGTKAWVCISEEYDAIRTTKELLKELNISFDSNESFNSLQVKLKHGLFKKKFLLVLDDFWNRDYKDWLVLSSPFSGGEKGSKIIVTTRDEKVALMMGSQCIYHLDRLSEEDCWSLFKKHAFPNKDNNKSLEFEITGKEIVKKCGGLPLAVKAIAGLLRSKETIEEWNEILRSDEWAETSNEAGILPSLKLSYTHLSSNLKQCFAYCALFHKDYQFSKDEVILLWMANDLLESPRKNKRLEDMGNEVFHELTVRSLFQKSSDGKFSMHDLVNDLAKYVSGKYFFRLEDHSLQNDSSIVARHFSYIISDNDVFEKFEPLNKSKILRTFLPLEFSEKGYWRRRLSQKILLDILPTFKSLRILALCGYDITDLPNSFANLKQLRLLDLSFTRIAQLPSWICTFCNLQTLLLAGCTSLEELPKDMEKLINLHYLDVREVPLTKMPFEIGKLENLQFLSTFIVSKDGVSRIHELGKLYHLHGEFNITGLENVASGNNASMAKMKEKKHIKKLTLNWSGDCNNSQVALDVLEDLQPHSNVEILEINGYFGTRFPNWLEDSFSFCHLVYLSISECENCFSLPAIGQLSSLKHLTIFGLSKVIEIGPEIYGDGCVAKPFPCLKELRILHMEEWREWHIPENGVFSCLEELRVEDCPKLIGQIPKQLPSLRRCEFSRCSKLIVEIPMWLPSLGELSIYECPEFVNSDGGLTICDSEANFPSLRALRIERMPNLKQLSSLSSDLNEIFPRLEELHVEECEDMVSFQIAGLPTTLKRLQIRDAGNWDLGTHEICNVCIEELEICSVAVPIKNLSLGMFYTLQCLSLWEVSTSNIEELLIPTSLQSLEIWGSDNLMSVTVGGVSAPNLTTMKLLYLPKLKSMPKKMHTLLPSLQCLVLSDCPEIECFPEGGLPSSLQSLEIYNCERLCSYRSEWGLQNLPSLTTFAFYDYDGEEETFPPEDLLLPSTLRNLGLHKHENLRKLDYRIIQHLTSLQSLYISYCPKLCSLPNESLPPSLCKLEIRNCPLLKHLMWEEGEDWSKVAHIPCIEVDGKLTP